MLTKGYIAISTVLVIMVAVIIISFSVVMLSVSEAQMSLSAKRGEEALNFVENCAEDALLRANEDAAYSGGTISLPEGNCNIAINKNGEIWDMTVSGSFNNYSRKMKINFTRAGVFTINSWQEI